MTALSVGDFGVLNVPAHAWRNRFVGWAIRTLTRSPYDHAITYVGDGRIGEAVGSGYRIVPLNSYNNVDILWSTDALIFNDWQQRKAAVLAAKSLADANRGKGVPYSFLDIAALAVSLITKMRTPKPIREELAEPDTMICSQAVDWICQQAGVHLFQGVLPGEVTPGMLGVWIMQHKQLPDDKGKP